MSCWAEVKLMLDFILGCFIGAAVGFIAAAMLVISDDWGDDDG